MSYFGSTEFYLDVAAGNIDGHTIVHKFGRNPSGTLGVEDTVSDLGQMQFPTSASTMRVKAGGNAADTAAGAGAREVTIYGLDNTGALAQEAVATAGAAASSATTTTFLRVFRARVTGSGTYATTGTATAGSNQGDIVIEDSSGTNDYITIPQYEGTTEYAGYHVPINTTAYLLGATIQVDASKSSDVILYQRPSFLSTASEIQSRRVVLYFDGIAGATNFTLQSPIKIDGETDLWWTFIPTANGTECAVDFELLIVDD
jgi:hypothetical protein